MSRDAVTRRRIRWVVFAALLSGGGGIALWILPAVVLGRPIIDASTLGLLVLPFPLAIAAAILCHHLFDIDVIVNRTLVYGALSASVVGIYVLTMGYLGMLFHTNDNLHTGGDLAISLFAAGLVAVLFQPFRDWLQRGVNRMMYGERDEPYAVLSRLGQRLEATLPPEAVPWAIDAAGQVAWENAFQNEGNVRASPAVADIDGDSQLEVILTVTPGSKYRSLWRSPRRQVLRWLWGASST